MTMNRIRKNLSSLLAAVMIITMMPGAGLAELTLPSKVRHIEASAFEGDTSLGEVILPEGIETIGARAFADASISRIHLPGSLSEIADDAFDGASVGFFDADRNTYAYNWLDGHGYLLHYSDEAMYDTVVDMAIFRDYPDMGLGNDWFAAWYELAEYEDLKDTVESEPVWTVTQTSGPAAEYLLQHYDGQASLSVAMPESRAVYTFTVACSWAGRSVSATATVCYDYLDILPTGTDIPERLELFKDQENVFSFHFTPEGFSFGNMDRVGFENYTGSADAWYDGHNLHIIPHEKGVFTGEVVLYAGNLYITRQVTFEVEALPEEITSRMTVLVDEETGKINMDALTAIPTDGITDPYDLEKIAAFNEAIPELQEGAAAYNTAMGNLYNQVMGMAAMLGDATGESTGSGFSLTTDLFSFSCGDGVMELLDGNPEIVSAEIVADAAQMVVRNGEQTGTLRLTGTGISLVSGSSKSGGGSIPGANALRAPAGRSPDNTLEFDSPLDFMSSITDALYAFGQYDGIGSAADAAYEAAGGLSPKLTSFMNNPFLLPFMQAFGIEEDCRHISEDIIYITEIYRKYENILSISGHGHPTTMEAADTQMTEQAEKLDRTIRRAIVAYGVDVTMTMSDIAANIYSLIDNVKNFGSAWNPTVSSFLDKGLNIIDGYVLYHTHNIFAIEYDDVRSTDRELHYEFSGIVWDQDMNPIQGVLVTLGANQIYTDAMGMYEMESATSYASPTFTREGYRVKDGPKSIVLTPYEKGTLSVQMILHENGGRIQGDVRDEITHEPISGATISYQGKYATSQTTGRYSIDAPYQKSDTMSVTAKGYARWRNPVAAPGTDQVSEIDVFMRPVKEWTITGTVYGETYDYEQKKWVKNPLAGATVTWGDATTTTLADGSYEIGLEGIAKNDLPSIVFSKDPEYETKTRGRPEIYSGTVAENFNCTLRIRYGFVQLRIVPEHHTGTNAFVRFNSSAKAMIGDLAEVRVPDSYPVPIGTYSISFDGSVSGLGEKTETVTVEEGKTATVTAILPWLYGLRGRVVNEDGNPMAGVTIRADSYKGLGQEDAYIKTDEDGRFYLFNSNPTRGGSFILTGGFISMDYKGKDQQDIMVEKGVLLDETYQVRSTEGKCVRSALIGVSLGHGQSVTRGMIADVTWDSGRSVHLEGEYNMCPKIYLLAEDENAGITVNASIGVNGKLYYRSVTDNIAEFKESIKFDFRDNDDQN